ncbi:MAG: hypothetical protein HYV09_08500 [Deltaproteobacteria bacterium]|nr:hypothetical protein [Deltaproteobacteria bacterium]
MPALDGCVVVSDPDFRGQDECLPMFLNLEADPAQSSTPRIPASPTDPIEFRGTVPLRSCALTKDYEARVFVDEEPRLSLKIPPSGGETRNVSVVVNVDRLAPGCHIVQVYVSSRFAAGDFRQPERPGDIDYLLWNFSNDASCVGFTR